MPDALDALTFDTLTRKQFDALKAAALKNASTVKIHKHADDFLESFSATNCGLRLTRTGDAQWTIIVETDTYRHLVTLFRTLHGSQGRIESFENREF